MILIVGCNDNTKPKEQYIDNDRPGDTATVYFDALYNQHNLQKARISERRLGTAKAATGSYNFDLQQVRWHLPLARLPAARRPRSR